VASTTGPKLAVEPPPAKPSPTRHAAERYLPASARHVRETSETPTQGAPVNPTGCAFVYVPVRSWREAACKRNQRAAWVEGAGGVYLRRASIRRGTEKALLGPSRECPRTATLQPPRVATLPTTGRAARRPLRTERRPPRPPPAPAPREEHGTHRCESPPRPVTTRPATRATPWRKPRLARCRPQPLPRTWSRRPPNASRPQGDSTAARPLTWRLPSRRLPNALRPPPPGPRSTSWCQLWSPRSKRQRSCSTCPHRNGRKEGGEHDSN
jgi:hypothetical protein